MRAIVFVAMLASCTFPEVQFGDAAVPIDSGSDGVNVNDAGADAPPDADDPCDKDHDGYKAEGVCGGNDCNDENAQQHPGQTSFLTDEPDAAPFGDWNCDGTVEKLYPFATCFATSCGLQSFTSDTGCGITNPFIICSGLGCPATDAGTRTQGCR
jgi:hypothetical protein